MNKREKLTKAERSEIRILLGRKFSFREIAKALGRSPNTMSYEVRENSTNGEYDPVKAHAKALLDRSDRDPTQGPPLMGFLDSSFIRPHVKPSP